ncbi:MAG: hypothetical protein WC262_10745 [Bacteroidales bacterium]|jgi:hypothetical protein|nr:hypothetical protein [Candidatus Omnitrophota bacterium]
MAENQLIVEEPKLEGSADQQFELCPRCGTKTEVKTQLAQSDVSEFVECVLAGTGYSKSYPLYGGALTLTVSAIRTTDLKLFAAVSGKLAELEKVDSLGAMHAADKLRVLLQIKHMYSATSSMEDKQRDMTAEHVLKISEGLEKGIPADTLLDTVFVESYKQMPLALLSGTIVMFSMLYNKLLNNGFDSNFWKSAGI